MGQISVYSGTNPYFFLSYSHNDKNEVSNIAKILVANNYRIWFDEGLKSGDYYNEIIESRIASCSVFLLMLSPASAASAYCYRELKLALKYKDKVKIRVLLIKDADPYAAFNGELSTIHYTKYDDDEWFSKITVDCSDLQFYADPSLTVSNGVLVGWHNVPNDLVIPESVTCIKDGLFRGNNQVCTLTFSPNDYLDVRIGKNCFRDSELLNRVYAPDGLHYVGANAFSGCKHLDYVKMSGGIYTLGEKAFAGCVSLSSFLVFGGISYIGDRAFEGCETLLYFYLLSPPKNIGAYAFSGWKENQVIRFYCDESYEKYWDRSWNANCKAKIIFDDNPQ